MKYLIVFLIGLDLVLWHLQPPKPIIHPDTGVPASYSLTGHFQNACGIECLR